MNGAVKANTSRAVNRKNSSSPLRGRRTELDAFQTVQQGLSNRSLHSKPIEATMEYWERNFYATLTALACATRIPTQPCTHRRTHATRTLIYAVEVQQSKQILHVKITSEWRTSTTTALYSELLAARLAIQTYPPRAEIRKKVLVL